MTKITIDVIKEDLEELDFNRLIGNKVFRAYEKATENEIKVGDLVYNTTDETVTLMRTKRQAETLKYIPCHYRLPNSLQEPLKDFIERLEK